MADEPGEVSRLTDLSFGAVSRFGDRNGKVGERLCSGLRLFLSEGGGESHGGLGGAPGIF